MITAQRKAELLNNTFGELHIELSKYEAGPPMSSGPRGWICKVKPKIYVWNFAYKKWAVIEHQSNTQKSPATAIGNLFQNIISSCSNSYVKTHNGSIWKWNPALIYFEEASFQELSEKEVKTS